MKNRVFLLIGVFSLIFMSTVYAQIACNFGQCAYTFSGNVQIPNTCGLGGAMLNVGKGTGANDPSIITAGSVGIGLPNPTRALDVAGDVYIRGTRTPLIPALYVVGNVKFDGLFDVNNIHTTSHRYYFTGNDGALGGYMSWIMSGFEETTDPGVPGLWRPEGDNVIGWSDPNDGLTGRQVMLNGDVFVGDKNAPALGHKNLEVSKDLTVIENTITNGNSFATTRTGGAIDIAEWIKFSGEKPETGDVVCVDEKKSTMENGGVVKKCDSIHDVVVGIVSTKPHLTMGKEYEGDDAVKFAVSGRVPVNVEGNVNAGDLLTNSYNGKAKSCRYDCDGKVVAKALTSSDNGKVLALITLQ